MADEIHVYTDGACSGNPGPGGWGVLVLNGEKKDEFCGGEPETTNNRMEMMAAIKALEFLPAGSQVKLHTDSTYVMKGITEWIKGWKAKGWKNSQKKPVKNKDLWVHLDDLVASRDVSWAWVKGHAGDPGNERADELANMGMDKIRG